jgi:hypothetical protein
MDVPDDRYKRVTSKSELDRTPYRLKLAPSGANKIAIGHGLHMAFIDVFGIIE